MPIVLQPPSIGGGQGSTENILPGSVAAQPPGLEAKFEYNNLILNERANLDTYIINGIDGLGDADIRDQRQPNPNYHGETAFNAWYGGRTIVLTGKIRAHDVRKLRDMQESLKLAFSSLEETPLKFISAFTNHDIQINCRKMQPLVMNEQQLNFQFTRDFMVTLRASDPRFRSTSSVVFTAANTGTALGLMTLINQGNAPSQPIFTITGPATDMQLTNLVTGDRMLLQGTISQGEIIIIDVLKRTMVDGQGFSKFNLLDITSDWMEIVPGTNTIDVAAAGITFDTSVVAKYQHTWL